MLLKNNQKPIFYEGGDYPYSKLFEWINIYSETFVFAGDKDQPEVKSKATKLWLNMATPFLTQDSANDICLKKDASLCVIYVAPNQADQDKVDQVFKGVSNTFQNKIDRGIQFQFIRLDTE